MDVHSRFDSVAAAERCIRRLHQLDILGHKLVVHFAKHDQTADFPADTAEFKPVKEEKNQNDIKKDNKNNKPEQTNNETNVVKTGDESFVKHGIPYPRRPALHYRYPPPTLSTLTNIANALAAHPKFYTQVLVQV